MEVFNDYIESIENIEHRETFTEVLNWVKDTFPSLVPRFAWNQPMFTDHGTFIIGFSTAKNHFAIAPEGVIDEQLSEDVKKAGYDHSKKLIRIRWNQAVNYNLLEQIISFNIKDKAETISFWR